MAGRSWRDLQQRQQRAQQPAAAAIGQSAQRQSSDQALSNVAGASPQLQRLLQQRQQLQERMQGLQAGGSDLNARDAARFQVASFAQRQAEARELQERRDNELQQQRQRIVDQRRVIDRQQDALRQRSQQSQQETLRQMQPVSERPRRRGQSLVDQVGTPPRSALNRQATQSDDDPMSGMRDWLSRRDRDREQLRDEARDRLAPLEGVRSAASNARSQLGADKLDELDRKLAAEDSSYERGSIQKDLAGSGLGKADKVLGKVESISGAAGRAVETLDQAWLKRRDRLEGAMDRVGPYVDRRRRRLSVDEGGSGDLFARMERNRRRALDRMRERQEQERRDDRRRQRALDRRREKEQDS